MYLTKVTEPFDTFFTYTTVLSMFWPGNFLLIWRMYIFLQWSRGTPIPAEDDRFEYGFYGVGCCCDLGGGASEQQEQEQADQEQTREPHAQELGHKLGV